MRSPGRLAAVALSCAALLVACSGDEKQAPKTPPDPRATVSGRVLDAAGAAVVGATVSDGAAYLATTDASGAFSAKLEAGQHRLVVARDGATIVERCVACAEWTQYDLGALSGTTPSGCAVVAGGVGDRDGDGLPDAVEIAGWDVQVIGGDGTVTTRRVTSDPQAVDTDLDGLADAEELAAGTDPTRKDTDGDGLSDHAELRIFKSSPTNVDSDGDSRGRSGGEPSDPNLWDGNELLLSGTSPVLADTDGDGRTDSEEIHQGGTSPLVADMPMLALEPYGDPAIEANTQIGATCGTTTVNLSRDEHEQVDTDTTSTKLSIENTVKLHTEAEVGTSTWPPTASAKLTTDTEFKHGYFHESSTAIKDTSVTEAQQKAECWSGHETQLAPGHVRAALKVRNLSDLSFELKELRVLAWHLQSGGRFSPIGTLAPADWKDEGYVLGPRGEMTFEFRKDDVQAETMLSLTQHPAALGFEVGGYTIFQLDETGTKETVDYAKLGEAVAQRTVLVVVDDGDGRVERRLLATSVFRNPDGSDRGVRMSDALATLHIPFVSEPQRDEKGTAVGKKVLRRVKDVEATARDAPGRGFWMVSGTGASFDPGVSVDFDDIVLKSGERVSLTYLMDGDRDGIFDREEYLLGTDPLAPDTDGDGLTDYEETKVGWVVSGLGSSRQVYPDPRRADIDGDYVNDWRESFLGADPYAKDTDRDGVDDTNDPYPLAPRCLDPASVAMAALWNGTVVPPATAEDVFAVKSLGDPLGVATDGAMVGGLEVLTLAATPTTPARKVFNFNAAGGAQATQFIEVKSDPSLSPGREFTATVALYRNKQEAYPAWATLFSKGAPDTATYALLLGPGGELKLSIRRNWYDKCWYCSFGADWACDDWPCADTASNVDTRTLLTPAGVVPAQTWVHVTASFGGETLRIRAWAEGAAPREWTASTTEMTWSGWYRHQSTTNYLVANAEPLRLGVEPAGAWPYSGMAESPALFGREFRPDDHKLFEALPLCPGP